MKPYIFDFDGTLVDSMPTYLDIIFKILAEHGISHGEGFAERITPLGPLLTAEYLVTEMGVPLTQGALFAHIKERLRYAYESSIPLKPHARDTLLRLKSEGRCLNILTASPADCVRACLRRFGLDGVFRHVWSAEEFKTGKDNPAIYRLAAKKLNVPPEEVILVDDNLTACKAAKAAGLTVFAVFDRVAAAHAEELKATADRYLLDLAEL